MINPPCGAYDVSQAILNVASTDNNFTVSQHMAGIINSGSDSVGGSLSVAGVSSFVGKCTFTAIPEFLAGILVDIAEVDAGILTVSGATVLNGGLIVVGALVLPSASIVQSEVASGYCDLVTAQSIAGIKTFASPPVLSGASISAVSIPAGSIVANSISNAQILAGGIGQASIAGGFVDMTTAQVSIAGAKSWTGLHSFSAGISDTSTLAVTGTTTLANLILPTSQTSLSILAGVVNINLGGFSNNSFLLPLTANVTSFAITGAIVNSEFFIYMTGDTVSRTVYKSSSSGSISNKNNLSGNTSIGIATYWAIRCRIVSSTLAMMDFTNFT
jgi:hypothetical protein